MEPSLEPYWANFTKIYSMPTLFPLIFAIQRIELPGLGSNSSIFLANIVLAVYFWLGPLNGSITGRYLWRRSDFFLNLHHRLLFPPHLHLRLSSSTSTSSSSSSSSTSSSSSSTSRRRRRGRASRRSGDLAMTDARLLGIGSDGFGLRRCANRNEKKKKWKKNWSKKKRDRSSEIRIEDQQWRPSFPWDTVELA